MKSSYASCRVGRADYVVLKPKPAYIRKAKEDRKGLKYTNREVLEVRWLYEFDGWTQKSISEISGIPENYVTSLLEYRARSHIVPKKDDFISFK